MSSPLNRLARPALVGVLLVAGLTAISGTASALPAGSYLQSCQNIVLAGDLLQANCRSKIGTLNPTTYYVSKCRKPGDNLSNINGTLRCAEKPPGGSWRDSCDTKPDLGGRSGRANSKGGYGEDGVVYDGILYTYCKTTSGQWRQTQIKVSSCAGGVIANINGRLICTR